MTDKIKGKKIDHTEKDRADGNGFIAFFMDSHSN
jgi:hypothetical protein